MPSAKPFLQRYRDGKISFDELAQLLVDFRWKPPSRTESVWGVDDPAPLGEEGTLEELAWAAEKGWITLDQERQIKDRLRAKSRDRLVKGQTP